jgi:hypothetical protein
MTGNDNSLVPSAVEGRWLGAGAPRLRFATLGTGD